MKKSPVYSPGEAIVTSSGLYIAREDYYIAKDITLADGTIFRKGKKFFTLDELLLLREAGEFPKGWDIPNECELANIAREFGVKDGIRHPHYLMTSLGLGLEGTPVNGDGYDLYNLDPANSRHCIVGHNSVGYYLGIGVDSANTCMLFLNDCEEGFYVTRCSNTAIGSARLVARCF